MVTYVTSLISSPLEATSVAIRTATLPVERRVPSHHECTIAIGS